ncbi:hypothetical protein COU57_02020 [Candidatus Pacearchaeota archaeon CG10_big_fil_rev_8_21_14_0_10_32_14]|nr:MAG: hypothetical protein COU57_02020 [Candidatus Pacearchaeota archaeon CG10_big_fil_rev_8_21_14_0_10_32_14]
MKNQLNAWRKNKGLNELIKMIKQKIRNVESSILALTTILFALFLIGTVMAESNYGSGSTTVVGGPTVSSPYEQEIELGIGESAKVLNLEIQLVDLDLLKTNPSVYQAKIKYGILPEGINKPVNTLTRIEGEKNIVTLNPTNLAIFFKSVSDDGKKAKFIVNTIKVPDNEKPGVVSPTVNYVEVYVYPEKQVTGTGKETYEVVVRDTHELNYITCKDTSTVDGESLCARPKYEYTLEFEGKDSTGSFTENAFTLDLGRKKSVELTVQTNSKGVHPFGVIVRGKDSKAVAKGVLVYGETPVPTPEPASYFIGDGFALSSDESDGKIIELKVLKKDNALDGKLWFENKPYKISGTVLKSVVQFEIYTEDSKEKVGSFSGNIKSYENFLLLRGTLQAPNEMTYDLTATGKRKFTFKVIDVDSKDEKDSESISIDETLTVTKKSETNINKFEDKDTALENVKDDLYIKPIKVKDEKILWIFPSGKKQVEVEIIKGDKITKEVIKEKTEIDVEGYKISVGSLDDEENIEFNVKKSI